MAKYGSKHIKKKSGKMPGALIKNLDTLNSKNGEGFLQAFPKTPAELRAEEEEKLKRQEQARIAEEKQKAEQERQDRQALLEIENEKTVEAQTKCEESVEETKNVRSLMSDALDNNLQKIKKIQMIDNTALFFVKAEKAVAAFVIAVASVFQTIGKIIVLEGVHISSKIGAFFAAVKKVYVKLKKDYYKEQPEKLVLHRKKRRIRRRRVYYLKKHLFERERNFAKRMVHLVDHVDTQNEKLAQKSVVVAQESNKKFNFAREWAELNKHDLIKKLAAVVIVLIAAVAIFNHYTAYEYYYNGRLIGVIKHQEDVLKITNIVSEQLSKEYSTEVRISPEKDIRFERVASIGRDMDNTEEVLRKLTYMRNLNVSAYAVFVDGKKVCVLDTKSHAKQVLNYVMEFYSAPVVNVTYENIGFKEKVQIKNIDTKLGTLEDIEECTNKLLTGATKSTIHTVVAGESLSIIARNYGLTLKELIEANSTLDPTKLPIGTQLVVNRAVPMVTVKTVEVAKYQAPIPYTTQTKEDAGRYQGDKFVKVSGVNGVKDVKARITRENGMQVASVELSSFVRSQPVNEVVVVGTKKQPPKIGTGKLKYPLSNFRLTSKYGKRWGGFHHGIDLAAPQGTRISAADGGTVVKAGYDGSYGNVIKIDHGGGVSTVYAHCSKILVRKGDRVFQGQEIGKVGNTGRSTGPHCHFEVRINGKDKNPLNYL